jgi:uncharacterized membrane protein
MDFGSFMDALGKIVDAAGVFAIIAGVVVSATTYVSNAIGSGVGTEEYRAFRQSLGRSILLGLELLVAGDIIRTVAASPTFRSVGVLVVIVLIRTFLSFSLELELTGRWPWQKNEATLADSTVPPNAEAVSSPHQPAEPGGV